MEYGASRFGSERGALPQQPAPAPRGRRPLQARGLPRWEARGLPPAAEAIGEAAAEARRGRIARQDTAEVHALRTTFWLTSPGMPEGRSTSVSTLMLLWIRRYDIIMASACEVCAFLTISWETSRGVLGERLTSVSIADAVEPP